MKTCLCVMTLTVGCGLTAALGAPTIQEIAPRESFVVLGASHAETMIARLQRTALWEMWMSEDMADARKSMLEEMSAGFDEMEQELGLEEDTIVPPSGPAGVAAFVARGENNAPGLGFIGFADFGDKADHMTRVIDALVKKAGEDHIEVDDQDVLGSTVYSFAIPQPPKAEADEFDDEFGGGGMGMPDPEALLATIRHIHVVRHKSMVLVSSDLTTLENAMEVIDGDALDRLASDPDFDGVVNAFDGDVDVYGAVLPLKARGLLGDDDMMAMMVDSFGPVLHELLGDVRGMGFGLRLDGERAMVEQTMSLYMPNGKNGLTALLNLESPRGKVPFFAGSDVTSFASINFQFADLMGVARKVIMAHPLLQMQAGPMLDQVAPMMEQFFAAMGSKVYSAKTLSRPVTADSQKSMLVMEMSNLEQFQNMVAMLAPQGGFQAREFLGHQIYTLEMGDMGGGMPLGSSGSMSIGTGAGLAFVGDTAAVEQALRASAAGGTGGIASEPAFAKAVAMLPDDSVIAWGISSPADEAEYMVAQQRKMIEDMREFWGDEMDPEVIDQMGGALNDVPIALIRKYVGPAAWQLRSVESGFVFRAFVSDARD
ncbi:MAG: hypothetical protein KDA25_13475 [Phycisphaerales bacterium]|nr:hypothetical protein [Phycisphaerales bacterium]